MTNNTPSLKERQEAICHLIKLGLIEPADEFSGVAITPLGIDVVEAFAKLDEYNKKHPK